MIACAGFSQRNSGDTICLPLTQVIQSLRTHDSLQICKRVGDSLQALTGVTLARIKSKDSTITDLMTSNRLYISLIESKDGEITNVQSQRDLEKKNAAYFKSLYKKQKTKLFVIGGALAAGLVYSIVHQ